LDSDSVVYSDPWINFSSQGGAAPPPGYTSQVQVLAQPLQPIVKPIKEIKDIAMLIVIGLGLYIGLQALKRF